MKSSITIALLSVFLFSSQVTPAVAALSDTQLRIQIQQLQTQIIRLQTLLAARQEQSVAGVRTRNEPEAVRAVPETLFTGPYSAVYKINANDSHLSLLHGTTDPTHDRVWNISQPLLEPVLSRISEIRFFNSAQSDRAAYTYEFSNDDWILALNTGALDTDRLVAQRLIEETVVHEFGHILLDGRPQIEAAYTERFWNTADHYNSQRAQNYLPNDSDSFWRVLENYYDTNPDRFATPYAVSIPREDMMETFTLLVYQPELASRQTLLARKARFLLRQDGVSEAVTHLRSLVY